jgi:hypothetical protein
VLGIGPFWWQKPLKGLKLVSKRVNSSKADTNDITLIEAIEPAVEATLL